MQALIAYYSFSHKVEFLANTIAESIDAEIEPIKPNHSLGNDKIVAISRKTGEYQKYLDIKKPRHNAELFDLIFVGTPVWAWDFVPFIRSWKDYFVLQDKKIAFFISHGGKKGNTISNLYKLFKDNVIIGHIDFQDSRDMDYDYYKNDIVEWSERIVSGHKIANN